MSVQKCSLVSATELLPVRAFRTHVRGRNARGAHAVRKKCTHTFNTQPKSCLAAACAVLRAKEIA